MPRTALTFPRRKTVENLLTNGNFEYTPPFIAATTGVNRWIDGTATGSSATESPYGLWTPSSFTASATAQFDTSVYRSGTASFKLSTLNATGVANAGFGNNFSRQTKEKTMVPVLPSNSYTLTCWIKTNNVNTNAAYIDCLEYDGALTTVGTNNSTPKLSGTNDWTQLTSTFTTSATTRFIYVVLRNNVAGNISDAWFDDITLVKSPVQTRKSFNDNILPNGFVDKLPSSIVAQTTGGTFMDGTAAGSATNTAYNWFLYTYSGTWSAIFDTSTKYSGLASIKLSTNAGSIGVSMNAFTPSDISWSRNNIPCEPNTTYKLSVKIKTELISGSATTGASAFVSHRTIDNSTAGIDTILATGIITTTDWTEYTAFMTTGPTVRFLNPAFRIVGNNGAATLNMNAWMDEFTITPQVISRKTPDNLLSNGNFEYAPPFTAAQTTTQAFINGTATGSVNYNSPYIWGFTRGNTATAQFDSTVSKFGTNSLKITTGSSTAYGELNLYGPFVTAVTKNVLIPALPNTAYTISWWMKTEYVSGDSSQGAAVGLIEYNGVPSSTTFNSGVGATIKITTDWTYYSYTVTTQSTTRYLNVQPRIYGHTGTGTLQMNAWFDDITLTTTAPYRNRKSIDNLIVNGDFESVPTFTAATNTANRYIDGTAAGLNATEFPYRWFAPGTFANATAQYDTSVKLTGTASMKLSTTTTAGLASALYGNNTSATNIKLTMIPVLPSTSYTVSGYCKTNNVAAAAAHIDIYEYNGAGTLGATNTTNTLTGTNDWTLVTKTFTTASTARYLSLALRNHVAGNVSDAWFDDITLVKN